MILKDHERKRIERIAAAWKYASKLTKQLSKDQGGAEINFNIPPSKAADQIKIAIRKDKGDKNVYVNTPEKPLVSSDGVYRTVKDRRKKK